MSTRQRLVLFLLAVSALTVDPLLAPQLVVAATGDSPACVVGGSGAVVGDPAPMVEGPAGVFTAGVYCTNTTGHNGHPGNSTPGHTFNDPCLPNGPGSWFDYVDHGGGYYTYTFYIPVQGVRDTDSNGNSLSDWMVQAYGTYTPLSPNAVAEQGTDVSTTIWLRHAFNQTKWKDFFLTKAHDVDLGYWYWSLPFDPKTQETMSSGDFGVTYGCKLGWNGSPDDMPPKLTPPSPATLKTVVSGKQITDLVTGWAGTVNVDPPAGAITHVPFCAWVTGSGWSDQPYTLAPIVAPFTVMASNGGTYQAVVTLTISVVPGPVTWDWGDGTTTTTDTVDPGHSPGQHPSVHQRPDGSLDVSSPCPVQNTYANVHALDTGRPVNGGPVRITATRSYDLYATATWWDGLEVADALNGKGPIHLTLGNVVVGQSGPITIRQIEGVSVDSTAAPG